MIIKEKIIFWLLSPVLIVILMLGFYSKEKKKESADEFLKEMEAVTEKARLKKKQSRELKLDIDAVKKQAATDDYAGLLERSIFFRPESEVKNVIKEEVIAVKEEKPKKPVFIYKGRMMVGTAVIVIIEDQNTGKSFSVKEGDMVGNFLVTSIDDKEVRLKKKDGEEIMLSTVKEERKEDKKEEKE